MEHICKICNKNYSSYQSLWIHNKKYHNNHNNHLNNHDNRLDNHFDNHSNHLDNHTLKIKKYNCTKCNKEFSHFQNRWRHEKTCKQSSTIQETTIDIKQELAEIKSKVQKLENKKNNKITTNIKVQGNIINGNNHDSGPKQIIYKTGTENVDLLNYNEVSTIFNNEISSVIKLIELVNFSENKPENHSFCSTNLESPYLSFYNTDTNSINKERKRHFFEEVICKSIQNHEILYKKFKSKFNSEKRKQIEDNIENLKMIKANSFNSKIMGELIRKLNLISYNKRDLIQDTWTGSGSGKKYEHDSDEEFMAMLLDDEETQKIIEENKKLNYDSGSNSDSDSDRPNLPGLNFYNKKLQTDKKRSNKKDLDV